MRGAGLSLPLLLFAANAWAAQMAGLPGGSYVPFYAGKTRQAVKVESFRIDAYPVARSEFREFVKAHPEWRRGNVKRIFAEKGYLQDWKSDLDPGSRTSPEAPVTRVSWFAARAYCESVGKSLPTTDEWEYAAADGGQGSAEAAKRSLEWFGKPSSAPLASRKSSAANGFGIHGLYDLIWEWTEDFNSASLSTDPADIEAANARFSCGGASAESSDPADYAAFMRYSFRSSLQAAFTTGNLGFRCASARDHAPAGRVIEARLPEDSLFRLGSRWKNERGEDASLADLRGEPVVLAMIYTHCKMTCPVIVSEMQRIEKALPEDTRSRVRFALFSFDSDTETPETLRAFAEAHGLDPSRWTLYTGSAGEVRKLATALSVRYRKADGGRYVHSNGITVLDAEGVPRFQRGELGGGAEEPVKVLSGLAGR